MLKIKKLTFASLLGLALLFVAPTMRAQTTLAAGDLLFTGFDSQPAISATGPRFDRISFVVLKQLTVNTVIYITDRGYSNGSWSAANANTEGSVKLTITTAVPVGREVSVILTPGYYAASVEGNSVATVIQQVSRLSMGGTGDQLSLFQSNTGEPNAPGAVLVAGLHWNVIQTGTVNNYTMITNDAGWDNLTTPGNPQSLGLVTSDIPPGLTAGASAFWIGGVFRASDGYNLNAEAAAFNGAGKPYASVADIRTAVLNRNNWVRIASGDGTAVTVPTNHFTTTLPVTLTKFAASLKKSGQLNVQWETASEMNNSHFVVQSSIDGKTWKDLARKEANAANSLKGASYSLDINLGTIGLAGLGILGLLLMPRFKRRMANLAVAIFLLALVASCAKNNNGIISDQNALNSSIANGQAVYLRLMQVDKDGKTTYSEAIVVRAQ